MNTVIEKIRQVKKASRSLCTLDDAQRNAVLTSLADTLLQSSDDIIRENAKDLALMSRSDPMYDRLLLTPQRIEAIARTVVDVTALPSVTGNVLSEQSLPNGLCLRKVSEPLGVVAVIYESRPNVTVDIFSLCFKAGNACILKGGKEARHSNTSFVKIIKRTLAAHRLDAEIVYLMPPERTATTCLLDAVSLVDVCIPRGSQGLIQFVRENAKIPVIETGAGIVHAYFDDSGDAQKGKRIIENAKTRRVSVCNALDSLVIHQERLQDLPELSAPLAAKKVEIFADRPSYERLVDRYPATLLHRATADDFGREFLSHKMSIKTVPTLQAAIAHIMAHTSGHSEAIIAEDERNISDFLRHIDAAVVYVNASTAFTDGGEFGMGAEIGISTQKLHARGPMGLTALTSYRWQAVGDGQVRE